MKRMTADRRRVLCKVASTGAADVGVLAVSRTTYKQAHCNLSLPVSNRALRVFVSVSMLLTSGIWFILGLYDRYTTSARSNASGPCVQMRSPVHTSRYGRHAAANTRSPLIVPCRDIRSDHRATTSRGFRRVDMAAAVKKTNQKVLKENERKWGAPLMKAGWCLLPTSILTCQQALGLKAIDINIIMHIASHWWYKDRLPFPSKAKLAAFIGVHKSTIQRRIARMEKQGIIRRIERMNRERGQMSNYYDLDGLIRRATPHAKELLKQKEEAAGKGTSRRPGQPALKVVHDAAADD